MAAPNEMTVAQLARLIATPNAPVLIDIRTEDDFAEDPYLIPGSVRHASDDVAGLQALLHGRSGVLICQKGKKLSQGLTSWLRADGIAAEYLQGGTYQWRDHPGALRVPVRAIPTPVNGATLWVTRHRPKIDRIACPWLIRRFVDPAARFLFVAPGEVMNVVDRFGATPFDVEGVDFSHRGDRCTFDTMLDRFELHCPTLDSLATVIRGADTNRHDLAPEAAGLLAISVGLSRQYRDDHAQLRAGMDLYDALYRWARDGQSEGHDWPTGHGS